MFYIWCITSEHPEGIAWGYSGRPQFFAGRAAAERTAEEWRRSFPEFTYTVHEGDPYTHRERMAARAEYPLDPTRPLELEDGTPVTVVSHDTCSIQIRLEADPSGDYPGRAGFLWNHYREDGSWCGRPGYLRLRHAGSAQLPLWKLKARSAEYRRPPECKVPWKDAEWNTGDPAETHFPHLEMVDGVPMVAFFASEQHAEKERLTKMRPGRYLKRYFGEALSNEEIERLTAEVTVQAGAMTVRWTQDADEIETIYVNGPDSCMSKGTYAYSGHCHPSRVYAGPDLAVAWLGDMDDASARAIVWPERKVYGGVYGDISRMTLLLEQMGFTEGDFAGARLRRIENEHGPGLILPYLDIAGSADDHGDCIVIGRGGSLQVDNTCGTTDDDRVYCESCEGCVDDDSINTVETGRYDTELWCDSCCSNHASFCDHTSEWVADSYVIVVEVHGGHYVINVREDRASDAGFVWVESRSEWWHEDRTFTCADCGEVFHVDDRDGRETGEDVCESCAEDRAASETEGEPQTERLLRAAEEAGQLRLPVDLPEASPVPEPLALAA